MNSPRVIGIDFGTTFTACALREPSGVIVSLPGFAPLPSRALATLSGEVLALEADYPPEPGTLLLNPKRIVFAHRQSSASLRWMPQESLLTAKFRPQEEINEVRHLGGMWAIEHQIHFRDPELLRESLELAEAAAKAILRRLRETVEAYLHGPLSQDYQYVLGVPAQSYAYGYTLKTLATQAGWPFTDNNVRTVAEPYAVLLAALLEDPDSEPTPGRYCVIDAGGGTTDWAVVDVVRQSGSRFAFHLLDTRSDAIGGSDIDVRLWERFRDDAGKTPAEWARLRLEREKVNLSRMGPGHATRFSLDGEPPVSLRWEELAAITREVFAACLADGRRALGALPDHVIVSGGASLSPGFLDLVEEAFQRSVRALPAEEIPYLCARGLTRVLDAQVHSGLEQDLAWVEYPSQQRTVWVRAFNQDADGAPAATFRFDQTPGIIPLFLRQGEEWVPAGYLKVFRPVETITPIWSDQRLEFRTANGERVPWVVEPFPYLRVGAAMAFRNNRFGSSYADHGQGLVIGIRHSHRESLKEWVGNPEEVTVEISPDGNAMVPVIASAPDWTPLDLTGRERLAPRDFPRLPRRPWTPVAYMPFRKVGGPFAPLPTDQRQEALAFATEPKPGRATVLPPRPRIRSAGQVRHLRDRIDHLERLLGTLKALR
ncbi:MAG: Hsp70 family protein [Firmicutes bacterium]|nr:Hsp70 family protein [Alicyclobacillaceae bacterium]MCL6497419.1 Hsp70 family protein [Bacillota bacterium]